MLAQTTPFDGTTAAETPEPSPAAARGLDLEDFRTRGRIAIREWIANRRDTDKSKRATERKEFDASIELAVALHGAGGVDVVADVLGEAEERLGPAQRRTKVGRDQARMAANIGAVYHRVVGDPRSARRMYRQALELDSGDEVAVAGMARLAREEEIDLQKEIETERIKELQEAFDKEPRSRPPATTPIDAIRETDSKP
jgi:hypothetical protein